MAVIANAAPARQGGRGRGAAPAPVVSTAAIPKESPLASRLERVPDIQAETTVGRLPRLPREIPAVYRGKAAGPNVRVMWPAPRDNSAVAAPGIYTVTGRVPGTVFEPKATITVRPADQAARAPARIVEPFPLGRVVLNQDTQGRDTPFIKNRDKFIKGLAASNPDSFLYNFLHGFKDANRSAGSFTDLSLVLDSEHADSVSIAEGVLNLLQRRRSLQRNDRTVPLHFETKF